MKRLVLSSVMICLSVTGAVACGTEVSCDKDKPPLFDLTVAGEVA